MKKTWLLCFFLWQSGGVAAQQLASWTQVRAVDVTLNPAIVDVFYPEGDQLDMDAAYRRQWTSFEEAPRTAMLGLQYTNEGSRFSVGGFLLNDRFGPTRYSQVQLYYSYQIRFDRRGDHFLSVGIGGGAYQFRLDGQRIRAENPSDPVLQDGLQSILSFNTGVGVYYQWSPSEGRFWFGGLSMEQALPGSLEFEGKAGRFADLKREWHPHAFFGGRFYLGSGYDFAEPLIWIRSAYNAPLNGLMSVRITMGDQRFSVGAGVSTDWALHVQFGVQLLEGWTMGYGNSSFLANTSGGATGMIHEFILSYRIIL